MRCLSFLNLQLVLDHLELVEDVNELFEKLEPLLRVLWLGGARIWPHWQIPTSESETHDTLQTHHQGASIMPGPIPFFSFVVRSGLPT